jgi:hypothetical protein
MTSTNHLNQLLKRRMKYPIPRFDEATIISDLWRIKICLQFPRYSSGSDILSWIPCVLLSSVHVCLPLHVSSAKPIQGSQLNLMLCLTAMPFTVAARFKAWNVFSLSNTGIVGSNPTQVMDICVCVRWQPCDGLIPRLRSPTDCLRLRHWSETKSFTDALCSRGSNRNGKKFTKNKTCLINFLFVYICPI